MKTTDADASPDLLLHVYQVPAEEQCFIVNGVLIVKPVVVIEWLETEFGLRHEQAMAVCKALGDSRLL